MPHVSLYCDSSIASGSNSSLAQRTFKVKILEGTNWICPSINMSMPSKFFPTESQESSQMESKRRSWVRWSSIGAGAFGAVHLAVDKSTGHVFAVKSVSLTSSPLASIHSLEKEIQILRSISSPFVVAYLGDDTTQDSRDGARRNLHIEYMPGGTAADAATMDEPRVRALARCVTRALRYLHDVAGVVHCDVKGRNVLLARGGRVAKLADFGSAVRTAEAGAGDGGRCNWVQGTPLWMAPEVARGERPTPAVDVWSLGCTVIEMVTGAPPWADIGNRGEAGAMLHIGYGDAVPEIPAHLSEVARDFVARCLRRDASERWTAEELLRHPFLAKGGPVAEPSPRGVLECANEEFCDEEDDDDDLVKERRSSSFDLGGENGMMAGARERVADLALDGGGGGGFGWCSDGWGLVRSSEMANSVEEEEIVLEEARQECLCCCSGESSAGNGGGVGEPSGIDWWVGDFCCSCSSCCFGCCCYFMNCSSSKHGVAVALAWKSLVFDLCRLLPQLIKVNKTLPLHLFSSFVQCDYT